MSFNVSAGLKRRLSLICPSTYLARSGIATVGEYNNKLALYSSYITCGYSYNSFNDL